MAFEKAMISYFKSLICKMVGNAIEYKTESYVNKQCLLIHGFEVNAQVV